jgi:tetratricopeptide (TPR) repeat protein
MAVAFASALAGSLLALSSTSAEMRRLPTLAAASLRPPLCREAPRAEQSALWSQALGGSARAFCETLARGQVRLERWPERALELGEEARALRPEQAAPWVLSARALLRLGQPARAHERFSASLAKKDAALADPAILRELAVAAVSVGRSSEALALYRKLIPRSELSAAPQFRRLVVLEAASLLGAAGPDNLAEVEVSLTEIRRGRAAPGLEDLSAALLSLALERKGDLEQASVVAAEIPAPWALERFLSPAGAARIERLLLPEGDAPETAANAVFDPDAPSLADGELHLAIAVCAAEREPKLARMHLQAYLDGPGRSGPWAGWARERSAALGARRR